MPTSLSNLVDNLSEELHKYTNCKLHEYVSIKDNQLILGVLDVKRIMKKILIKN